MFCCDNTESLCSIGSCEPIDLGANAPMDGDYVLEWGFAGAIHSETYPLLTGEPLIFPNTFNESGLTVFRLFLPDGSLFKDQCYSIQVYPNA